MIEGHSRTYNNWFRLMFTRESLVPVCCQLDAPNASQCRLDIVMLHCDEGNSDFFPQEPLETWEDRGRMLYLRLLLMVGGCWSFSRFLLK
jgi:hypothetical protein